MSIPAVAGLDLSLTATGYADPDGITETWSTIRTGMPRLSWFRNQIRDHATHVDVFAIESYSMGTARQNSHAHALGELGGVVRLTLYLLGVPYVDIAPASLKKYSAGRGNANKNDVLVAAVKRLGYDGSSTDEADALWLRAAALDHYGHPVVYVPAAHRAALAAVQWPALREAGAA